MLTSVVILLVALIAYWAFDTYVSLERNIAEAKASGLPYVVVPVNIYNRFWLIFHGLLLPTIKRLPDSWTRTWIDYMEPNWAYTKLYSAFEKEGNDTFLTVSPKRVLVWTATPSIIHTVTQKRELFPKPLDSYKILDIYGKSLVSLEGSEWKKHRKITSPSFTENNNRLVFHEAVAQTQAMLRKWMGDGEGGRKSIKTVPEDSMRLALHIISMVGFGVRLLWPGEEGGEEDKIAGVNYGSSEPPEGHTMSFAHALESLLENLVWVLLFPKWLLPKLPFAGAKLANEAYANWSQFMNELFTQKVKEAKTGQKSQGMDLLGGLVKSSYSPDSSEKEDPSKGLSDSEILGNAFVMILAGHETTANSIHFASVLLATEPSSQRNLQKEVQNIFGDAEPVDWDYEKNINGLLGGMVGAVLNEELRLLPPVIAIPKTVLPSQAQQVHGPNGEKYTLPKGAFVNLVSVAVGRNPGYWPSMGKSKVDGKANDLNDFVPERWLVEERKKGSFNHNDTPQDSEVEDFGGFTGTSSSSALFRPAPGSFIPFSEGARSCIGRRLAQVEVVAVLSTIFQRYSVELAVDQWASDDEVEKMSDGEKRAVYQLARDEARRIIRDECSTRITLKLHGLPDHIPVRVLEKGKERFLHLF